jgi:hypothetical protein
MTTRPKQTALDVFKHRAHAMIAGDLDATALTSEVRTWHE